MHVLIYHAFHFLYLFFKLGLSFLAQSVHHFYHANGLSRPIQGNCTGHGAQFSILAANRTLSFSLPRYSGKPVCSPCSWFTSCPPIMETLSGFSCVTKKKSFIVPL